MIDHQNTILVIPARLASRRLPGKVMTDINGAPLVVHVWRRAMAAKLGHVLVAAADSPISAAIERAGGDGIVTAPNLPSGADRVAAALALRDPGKTFEYVLVLPAIYPDIDTLTLSRCLAGLTNEGVDISTIATRSPEHETPDAVRVLAPLGENREVAFARDFLLQDAPNQPDGQVWHHIPIYAFRRAALERFASLPRTPREVAFGLEQLRAVDNGMKVAVVRVDSIPLCVETQAGLERARQQLKVLQ